MAMGVLVLVPLSAEKVMWYKHYGDVNLGDDANTYLIGWQNHAKFIEGTRRVRNYI